MEKTYLEKIQIHKDNGLAALYPSTKFFMVILYIICTFFISTVHFTEYQLSFLLIPWFLVVLLLCKISGVFKKSIRALKAVAFIAVVILVVQTFLVPGGELIFKYGFLKIYEKGLATAISLSFMIMNIAGVFVWFFQTTENKEIAGALEASGMNHKAAYIFISTLQMTEILSKNSKTIMNAQRARGIETEGNLFVRAKAFLPSLVPLILGAVINSEERVLTLEARGFAYQGKKTHIFEVKKTGNEKKALVISVVLTILIAGGCVLWNL